MAVIQKREEEKREEKRRKEIAKQVLEIRFIFSTCAFISLQNVTGTILVLKRWFCFVFNSQERLESMEQSVSANPSLSGKGPPSPGGAPPELTEAKKVCNRRRTASSTRHR